jgi:hypothetical protein
MNKILNECGRKQSCPNLRYYPGLFRAKLKEASKKLQSEQLVSSDGSVHRTSLTLKSATTTARHPTQFPTE